MVYVGKSKSIKRRWYDHKKRLKENRHYNPRLQNSYNKHGASAFKFDIIELCDVSDLIAREEYWIDWYVTAFGKSQVYNLRFEKDGKLTEETKSRLRKSGKAAAEKQHKTKEGGLLYNFHTKEGVRLSSYREGGLTNPQSYTKGLIWFKGKPTEKDIKKATEKYERYLKSQTSSNVVIVAKSLEEYWTFRSLRAAANFVYDEKASTKNDMIKNAMDRDLKVPRKNKQYYIFSSIGELFHQLPKYSSYKVKV